jgi:hypothetical protein
MLPTHQAASNKFHRARAPGGGSGHQDRGHAPLHRETSRQTHPKNCRSARRKTRCQIIEVRLPYR